MERSIKKYLYILKQSERLLKTVHFIVMKRETYEIENDTYNNQIIDLNTGNINSTYPLFL